MKYQGIMGNILDEYIFIMKKNQVDQMNGCPKHILAVEDKNLLFWGLNQMSLLQMHPFWAYLFPDRLY